MESFINNAMERDEEQEDNQENNPVIKDLDETQTSEDEYPKDDYVNEYSKPEEAQAQEEESVVETDPEPVREEVREEPIVEEEVKEEEPESKPEIKREIPEVKSVPKQEVRTTSKPMRQHELDAELEMLLAKQKATVKVIGTGGGGNNTINRITEVGIEGSETIAMNTDAQDLLYTTADKKILLGRELTGGLGAGSIPKIGEEAAMESEQEIKQALQGADMVFVTCGLGGGTGTGSAPVVASVAKKLGALTVAIVTLPFSMEGNRRYDNAILGLERLQETVDTLIVIPNDKLLELAPDLPMQTAFKVADEILTNAVKGIAELVTKAGLVNLDFADIRAVMGNGGVALIGVGESDTENRATEAVERAINNPLLDADITGANGALINVAGGPDMTLEEARRVVESVSEKLDEDARVIWGAQIAEDLSGMIRTMLIVTGVKSSQILGGVKKPKTKDQKEAELELGIEFM
jgi:cell division protein FtsZ